MSNSFVDLSRGSIFPKIVFNTILGLIKLKEFFFDGSPERKNNLGIKKHKTPEKAKMVKNDKKGSKLRKERFPQRFSSIPSSASSNSRSSFTMAALKKPKKPKLEIERLGEAFS